MIFRCLDKNDLQKVRLKDFAAFIENLDLGFDEVTSAKIANIFDEDCSGDIDWDEFRNILVKYSVREEGEGPVEIR
jgi:Ca2+-binding EF-hand superfamily protein